MSETTKISWTDHTFNIAHGCVKVSPGCANCYAETQSSDGPRAWRDDARNVIKIWGPGSRRRTFGEAHWRKPNTWNRKAQQAGEMRRVFCSSMCDVFEDHPTIDHEREKLWPVIRATPWLQWQVLTKRADRIADYLPADWRDGYENVWLGVSIETNDYVWRAEQLREIPAVVHFVSYEPALGPLDALDLRGLQWVIYGGESGPKFRPEDKQWARDMRDRCRAAGVAFFHKQSADRYTERGVQLDGETIQQMPLSRKPRQPRQLF